MKDLLKHIEKNEATFKFWIERNEKLQASNDVFKPIIPVFEEQNPGAKAVSGCPDCLIDMLRWCIKILKESKPEKKDK